jgi:predicted kinase
MQPKLYLFVGYPGAGKTTVAQIVAETTGAVHLWADKERHDMFGGVYRQEQSDELYRLLNEHAAQLLRDGKSVIFDTNFNYYRDREHLRHIASEAGASAILIWLKTPEELAYRRAVAENGGKRLFITMSHEDFERVASHLEPPHPEEHAVEIDGTHVDPASVKRQLRL